MKLPWCLHWRDIFSDRIFQSHHDSILGNLSRKLSIGNSHWDRLVHCHHYRHSWIRSRCCVLFGVAIVRCNYFRPRSTAATFVVDGTVAAVDAGSGPAVADVNWVAASVAFVDSD